MVVVSRLVPISHLEESLNQHLQVEFPQARLTIQEGGLTFGSWRSPIGFRLSALKIIDTDRQLTMATDRAVVLISMRDLLSGRVSPTGIHIPKLHIHHENRTLATLSCRVNFDSSAIFLHVSFDQLAPMTLFNLWRIDDSLPQDEVSFSGVVKVDYSHTRGVEAMSLNVASSKGKLYIPGVYESPPTIDRIRLKIEGDAKHLIIDKLILYHGNAKATATGRLTASDGWKSIWEKGGYVTFFANSKTSKIPLEGLSELWPQALAKKARKWVTENIKHGTAETVRASFGGSIRLNPLGLLHSMSLSLVQGTIDANHVTFTYFGQLPPVVDAKGFCKFSKDKFIIDATGAAEGIAVKRGHIEITDLDKKDQFIDIDLDLAGGVREALEILSKKPLEFPKKLGLETAKVSGDATTHLRLYFLLEQGLPLDQVDIQSVSHIKDAQITTAMTVADKPIELIKGNFELTATRQSLLMDGKGVIRDIPVSVVWRENFDKKRVPFARQLTVKGDASIKDLNKFGLDLEKYISGPCAANLTYLKGLSGEGEVTLSADLAKTFMEAPILMWKKKRDKAANLVLGLTQIKDGHAHIKSIKLEAKNLIITGSGGISPETIHLDLHQCLVGSTGMKGRVSWHRVKSKTELTIDHLDLAKLLEDTKEWTSMSTTPDPKDPQMKTKLTINTVKMGENSTLKGIKGDITTQGDFLIAAKLHGLTSKHSKPISIMLKPLSLDKQEFTLLTEDGGDVLETLGAGYDLEGGVLKVTGIKSIQNQSWSIAGKINIDEFTVLKAPLLARMLSAASLTGLINLFAGQGIQFNTGTAEFVLTPHQFELKDLHLESFALALIMNGHIDRDKNLVDFDGELVPIFFINTVVANIPIVGQLLSGGRTEGVFITNFKLKGNRDDPELNMNPISAVTPGIMREPFRDTGKKKKD